ncbi:hypothetical protein RBSH_00360 [Rhodopirellula baltica SH28]|uniref:Uncharacterized protein n=1 Tax=Rhodopirellula baltica SH28 TaxID=993517 RepID=K5DPD2_RHOBT|nr:hypothetical protein RBSH_00360 [Rhodopirellula baltica SH28]
MVEFSLGFLIDFFSISLTGMRNARRSAFVCFVVGSWLSLGLDRR